MTLNATPFSASDMSVGLSGVEVDTAIPSTSLAALRSRPLPPATVAARRSCFQVTTVDGPQILLKLLGLFAARDLTPAVVRSTQERGKLHVEIMLDGMEDHMAEIVANKIASFVEVEECFLSRFARV